MSGQTNAESHHSVDFNELPLLGDRQYPGATSRDGSLGSSLDWRHSTNEHGRMPRTGVGRIAPQIPKLHNGKGAQEAPFSGRDVNSIVAATSEKSPKVRRSGGIRTVLRRLFSKRSTKKHISLPAPVEPKNEVCVTPWREVHPKKPFSLTGE